MSRLRWLAACFFFVPLLSVVSFASVSSADGTGGLAACSWVITAPGGGGYYTAAHQTHR